MKKNRDKFKIFLIILLVAIGTYMLFMKTGATEKTGEVDFFYLTSCPHCSAQKPFNEILKKEYPDIKWVYHDASLPEEAALLSKLAAEKGITNIGVPATFFGDYYNIGFDSAETTGKKIKDALDRYSKGESVINEKKENIVLPLIGELDVKNYSIPALAVILGLIDGFNPCAMWVLVYLISLVISLNDRRKVWLIVGSFVLASGILYFLFMTAWLNAFLLVGYYRPITLAIGLFAVYSGIMGIREFIKTKGAIECKVEDGKSKMKTIDRMKKVVFAPLTLATIFGIIALAFAVNSIEFVCSSAIPAIFTQVLALSNLSPIQHYGYILLYDFFFMLDDLLIFSLAAFAVNTSFGDRYAKYCKILGAILLFLLGIMMVFMPGLLR